MTSPPPESWSPGGTESSQGKNSNTPHNDNDHHKTSSNNDSSSNMNNSRSNSIPMDKEDGEHSTWTPKEATSGKESPLPRQKSYSPPPSARYGTEEDRLNSTTIFVGNLPFDVKEAELEDLCGTDIKVKAVRVGMNYKTGSSRGYAFVSFFTRDEAEAAFKILSTRQISGRNLRLDWDIGLDKKRHLQEKGIRKPPPRRYQDQPYDRPRRGMSPGYRMRRSRSPPPFARRGGYRGGRGGYPISRSRSPPPRRDYYNTRMSRSPSPRRRRSYSRGRSPGRRFHRRHHHHDSRGPPPNNYHHHHHQPHHHHHHHHGGSSGGGGPGPVSYGHSSPQGHYPARQYSPRQRSPNGWQMH